MAAVALLFSCGSDRRSNVVAKAGSSVLTEEGFTTCLPEGFQSYFGDDALIFISQWADEVILAEASKDLKLDLHPDVSARLEEARRMILAAAFEQYYILPKTPLDSAEIVDYYQNNQEQFIRDQDEVLLYHITVLDEETRDSIIELIDSVEFEELAERWSIDPMGASINNKEFLTRDQIHPIIARRAFSMGKGEIDGPIETEFGYHFIKIVDFKPKGSLRQFSEVSEGIRDFLAEQKFQEKYMEILDSLRIIKSVEIDTNAVMEILKQYEK